jgi:hypothetical protein
MNWKTAARTSRSGPRSLAKMPAIAWAMFFVAGLPARAEDPPGPAITFETQYLRWVVGSDGHNMAFVDKRAGKDYLDAERQAFALISRGGKSTAPASCSRNGDLVEIRFAELEATVTLKVTEKPAYVIFEISSVSKPTIQEVSFGIVRLALPGRASGISGVVTGEEFAASARALNLQTMLQLQGGPRPILRPMASVTYGLAGAKVALVGCPAGAIRGVLQDVVRGEGLPFSPLGGPFALDAEETRGSYVFATVSEKSVDDWISLAKKAGLAEIHLIGWEESLGTYSPRKDLFPGGLEGLKSDVAKIHAAGLKAGMHTLTGGISRNDPFVTPVPDQRLAKDGQFTLAADVGDSETIIPTAQPPGDLETSWQYSGRSNVIQIDEELIAYSGLSKEDPRGFTSCTRGAFGTRPFPHLRGAAVHHLFAIYGTFQPDENSTLVDDVAERIAKPFNECGFDMMYQDGAEGMPGGPYGWAKMREAVFRRLKGRVLVEASEWGYHSWPFHSRIGAYDHPNWGLKRFTDVHCKDSEEYRASSLLAAQLGWWAILGPDQDHPAEFPDEIEYLCAKSLATDMAMSFQGIDVGQNPWNARQNEYLEMIGRYERLRLARAVPESARARLSAPGQDFRLRPAADGTWRFVPADYLAHRVEALDDPTIAWTLRNRHGPQPLRARIEALYSAAPYEAPEGIVLASFEKADELTVVATAQNVSASWVPSTDEVRAGKASARCVAASGQAGRSGAWAALRKSFAPTVDISKCGALGVWILGDGNGEIINFQLTNPVQFWPTWDEHYVDVDFKGWRYLELHLRERDAERFGDHVWPYGGTSAVFRSPLIRSHVSALSIYYNNLPPGETVTCHIAPIKALPVAKVRLKNPTLIVGGAKVVFPVTLESGQYIEMESADDCRLHDERGALIQRVAPVGEVPTVAAGENQVSFSCEGPDGRRARAKVTVITCGEPLEPALRP